MNNVIPPRMIVPIRLGRQFLGVMDLIDGRQGSFGEVDLYTIWRIADQVGTALENARESRPPSTRRAVAWLTYMGSLRRDLASLICRKRQAC